MRYIQKELEPKSLTEYKKQANAYYDGYPEKDDVRKSLLKEQGGLCGYCMRRLKSEKDVKIEHVIPQSTLNEDERQALDYRIMLGVCYGNEKKGRKFNALTCDAHRKNVDLHVTPFDQIGIDKIRYTSEGYIASDDPDINDTLNNVLNLNYDGPDMYLVQNRRAVLDECKMQLRRMQKEGLWKRKNLERVLHYYETPNKKGEYVPFSGVAICYIKKQLKKGHK